MISFSIIAFVFKKPHTVNKQISQADEVAVEKIIDKIPQNPVLAAERLKKYNTPTAKIFLAFLYSSGKVEVWNKHWKINHLMKSAIQQIKSEDSNHNLNEVGMPDDFKTLKDIFFAMKFSVEDIPMWMAKEYPDEIFDEVLTPYFGCNRDNFLARLKTDSTYEDVTWLKSVKPLLDYTLKKYGKNDTPYEVRGTIRYMYGKEYWNLVYRASIDPKYFMKDTKAQLNGVHNDDPPYTWDDAWKVLSKDEAFMKLYNNAFADLKARYENKFQLESKSAEKISNNVLSNILIWYYYNGVFGTF